MPAVVIVGAQWGDEGKGKATDLLGERVDYVVKPNGGNNAGHTVVVDGEKFELKLLPAGILSPQVTPVIGNGVVVHLGALFEEIEMLESRGVDTSRLRISANAHIVAPYHQTLDKVTERFLGKRAIGTTGRGIGPAYMDKIGRLGIRVQDLFDESILRQKIEGALRQKNELLVKLYNRRSVEVDEIVENLLSYAEQLEPMVVDTTLLLNDALDRDEVVLMEGGQATYLDVDHGTYPFRDQLQPHCGRRLHRHRRRPHPHRSRDRDRQGVHHPRGRRSVPHRARGHVGRVSPARRRRGGREHRASAPLRLVRRADDPPCGTHQRLHGHRADEARRAHRHRRGADLHRL